MGEKQLHALLEQLHQELEVAESVTDQDRELLAEVVRDIENLVGAEQRLAADQSLQDRLDRSVVVFENRHPRLSFTLERLIEALTAMGI